MANYLWFRDERFCLTDEMGYRLPYDRVVARTPSFEDMRQTVCHQGIRLDVNVRTPLLADDNSPGSCRSL